MPDRSTRAVRRWVRTAVCLGAVTGGSAPSVERLGAQADSSRAPSRPPPLDRIATLTPWADEVWLALLDRDGSWFGRLAEEGTFQRFNPLMDDEYELDIWTGMFTGSEDARWKAVRTGLRAAGASVSHPHLLTAAEWRQDVPVAGPVVFVPRFVRLHTLSTRRDYVSVAAEWRGLGQGWVVQGGFGVHSFKASGDIELAVSRRRGGPGFEGELRLALLDAFNNAVFELARGNPGQTPIHFHYRDLPRAARLRLGWSTPGVRAEVHAGVSTRSRVEVTFPVTRDSAFSQAEALRFLGGLVEVSPGERVSLALYATTARADTERRFDLPGTRDFTLLEETSAVGTRGRLRLTGTAAIEVDGRVTWRPERRSRGDGPGVRHDDREVVGQAVVVRRPERGWLWRLGVAFTDREAGELAPQLAGTNTRDLMEVGYRFRSGFELAFGLRWDLDGAGVFDGGHLRLAATW